MSDLGYRGYIVSAPVRGSAFPQRVQNLVIRDYAQRRKLAYRLSLTEYAMQGSTMMLESMLADLDRIEGIILFSLFTLPRARERRQRIYERILGAGKTLHAALEQLVLSGPGDVADWDDLIDIDAIMPQTPFGGRYEKDDQPLGPHGDGLITAFELKLR